VRLTGGTVTTTAPWSLPANNYRPFGCRAPFAALPYIMNGFRRANTRELDQLEPAVEAAAPQHLGQFQAVNRHEVAATGRKSGRLPYLVVVAEPEFMATVAVHTSVQAASPRAATPA